MGIALGVISKPFQPRDLVRSIAVCEKILGGRKPGRLPARLSLFDQPEAGV